MKYLPILLIVLYACKNSPTSSAQPVAQFDSPLTKEKAQSELDKLRASVTDSNFAAHLDASLQLDKLEFKLKKSDSTRKSVGFSDSLIVQHPDGAILYKQMMRLYSLVLDRSKKETDIQYFRTQLNIPQQQWLDDKFKNKRTFEALITIMLLRKDAAVASMITSNADSKENREMLDEQYNKVIQILRWYEKEK